MNKKLKWQEEMESTHLSERYFGLPSLCCKIGVPLQDQPHIGHNRWHPDIEPRLFVTSGDEFILEAIDPFNAQLTHDGDLEELAQLDLTQCHPLTGPVFVRGAEPGDLLEVEILNVEPLSGKAFSNIFPGLPGWLGERINKGFRSTWYARGSIAESLQLPGIRIPIQPHPGTIGVAPSHELVAKWEKREREVYASGKVWVPTGTNALAQGLTAAALASAPRTQPPRENGGNMDINRLGAGSRVYFPVFVEGALLSLGDHHLAAGDGECSYNAMEMDGRSWLRVRVLKDAVNRHNIRTPLIKPGPIAWQPARDRYLGFTGFSFDDKNQGYQDVTLASREAILRAVDYLTTMGYRDEQAYTILSVAPVEFRISCVVTPPNISVTLYLPLDIFDQDILPRDPKPASRHD